MINRNTSEPPQKTVIRIFRLIRYLTSSPAKGVDQMAQWLGVDKRSVYRYFHLLDTLGYVIQKDEENRYFIAEADPRHPNQFTAEESSLVRHVLGALPKNHPLLESIKKKVYLTSELIPLVDDLVDLHRARLVEQLAQAISQRKQVRLIQYHSVNSQQVSDRWIEPLRFSDDYAQIEAFEQKSQRIKTFKVQRIEQVEILETYNTKTISDDEVATDAFGFSGEAFLVQLHLSRRAYRLLIEEFPSLRPYTQPRNHIQYPYRFLGEVCNEIGIGRFILGLPAEIEVESPQRLKDYLNGRIKDVVW